MRIFSSPLCFSEVKLTMKSCGCSVKPAYLSSGGDRALGVDCCGTEKLHAFKTFSDVEKRKFNVVYSHRVLLAAAHIHGSGQERNIK